MSIRNSGTHISNTYKPQSEANAAAMIPQTGGDVRMAPHGTVPRATCKGCVKCQNNLVQWTWSCLKREETYINLEKAKIARRDIILSLFSSGLISFKG